MNPPGNGAVPAVLPGGAYRLPASATSPSALVAARSRTDAPALIAVAHGSRDPRSAATMRAVVDRITAQRPDLDVRLAFLDLSTPSVDQVVDAVAADGHSHAIVVPLLLGSAFHARVDLPDLLDEARARHPRLRLTQADVLGPDPHLIIALRDRIVEALYDASSPQESRANSLRGSGDDLPRHADALSAGIHTVAMDPGREHAGMTSERAAAPRPNGTASVPRPNGTASVPRLDGTVGVPRLGIAVAAVGSSSTAANARTGDVARLLTALTGWDTEICFATTDPTLDKAFARLRARGAERILVAPWFLAPGLLTDRLRNTLPHVPHADTIGAHPLLAEVALDRYATAALPLELSA